MSLHRYVSACSQFVSELTASLSEKDIEELRKDCAAMGIEKWALWFFENEEMISKYVRATPGVRAKRKLWQEPVLRRRLTMGGILYLGWGRLLLDGLVHKPLDPGFSYRDTAADAAELYSDLFHRNQLAWPFDDPDPFS